MQQRGFDPEPIAQTLQTPKGKAEPAHRTDKQSVPLANIHLIHEDGKRKDVGALGEQSFPQQLCS